MNSELGLAEVIVYDRHILAHKSRYFFNRPLIIRGIILYYVGNPLVISGYVLIGASVCFRWNKTDK